MCRWVSAFTVVMVAGFGWGQAPQPSWNAKEPRLLPPIGSLPTTSQPSFPPSVPLSPSAVQSTPQPDQPRATPKPDPSVVLPRPEHLVPIDPSAVTVRRVNESWQLWVGRSMLRDFGQAAQDAKDALDAIRNLRPTEWGMIGTSRPVVEYGLVRGEPPGWVPYTRRSLPIDLKSVRAEPVRGAWVVRDDDNILLNFGPHRDDAQQAAQVAKRYGFNRVGLIGYPNPTMAYYYSAPTIPTALKDPNDPAVALARAAQEGNLARTAIDVPGVGLVGERIALDPRQLEVRKDRIDWVLAHGPDVIARFGYSEMAARDALRVIRDSRLTEFCQVGNGLTFFLTNGQAPTRVSFAARQERFDFTRLAVRETGTGGWGVFEGAGRLLFPTDSREEAELAVRVIQAYRFDTRCQVGASPKASLQFLAKSGR